MKLSVIIPTLNRAKLLEKTLKSIENQTMKQCDFEIIVIDNGSRDTTYEICKNYNDAHNNLIYLYDDNQGLHIGRHRGYYESKTDILVYADDDISASKTWLDAIYKGFQEDNVGLIGGNDYPLYDINPPKWMNRLWFTDSASNCRILQTYSVIVFNGGERRINPDLVFGCNFSVKRDVIKLAGGFHPDGVPEKKLMYRGDGETHISRYIKNNGMKAMYYPEASVGHRITKDRMRLEYVQKVAYRSGVSDAFSLLREINSSNEYFKCLNKTASDLHFYKSIMNLSDISDFRDYYYKCGKLYLFNEFRKHNKIRKWIKKADYFDAIIPE